MSIFCILLVILFEIEAFQGWKQLGCNSFGNFRSNVMGHLRDWNMSIPDFNGAFDMILTNSGYLILQTQLRKDGFTYCGMSSVNFNTGELIESKFECSNAFAGTMSSGNVYVYAKNRKYNTTTEVIAINEKFEVQWQFHFTREFSDNNAVAVLPIDSRSVILVTGPSSYPESGIGYMHYSNVYSFDVTSTTPKTTELKPKWKKEMKRGSVLYYRNNLYFKSAENMMKVDPSSGNILQQLPIEYPRVYSNLIVSEKHDMIIYNCGLPLYEDPNHNQCAIKLSNFSVTTWTHTFPGDHSCYNIALSNDESLIFVQCKFDSWTTKYKIAALDIETGKIVRNYSYEGMIDTYFRKMSAVIMNDGSVIVPMVGKIVIFDNQLKSQTMVIEFDQKKYAFYGAMLTDGFKCFSYCLSAASLLYGGDNVVCFKKCL